MKECMKYLNLIIMSLLSFISMYILMYIMVDSFANVYSNLNQLYMAGLMTIPMVVIELLVMNRMYNNKKINILIITVNLIALILIIIFVRKQTAIFDREFLKSMIPHHAAAILMCEKASLEDPEVKALCRDIISAQQSEIKFMKQKLEKLK
ncbi:DUF305 domain-containing protein [candidate division TM6 bacterium RIFCSPHIGHO2_12_FULL_32_22]|nr:MAG: DUF305 domain-containing protein [candidate division TM6 bacterium RIFCSPHIGHO2_12_FULL_32_22]